MKTIETAPRDGTLILGIVKMDNPFQIEMDGIVLARTARWFETKTSKYNPDGGFWLCPYTRAVIGPFTHWMENPKQLQD